MSNEISDIVNNILKIKNLMDAHIKDGIQISTDFFNLEISYLFFVENRAMVRYQTEEYFELTFELDKIVITDGDIKRNYICEFEYKDHEDIKKDDVELVLTQCGRRIISLKEKQEEVSILIQFLILEIDRLNENTQRFILSCFREKHKVQIYPKRIKNIVTLSGIPIHTFHKLENHNLTYELSDIIYKILKIKNHLEYLFQDSLNPILLENTKSLPDDISHVNFLERKVVIRYTNYEYFRIIFGDDIFRIHEERFILPDIRQNEITCSIEYVDCDFRRDDVELILTHGKSISCLKNKQREVDLVLQILDSEVEQVSK